MRKYTNLILEQIENGNLTADYVVKEVLANWMSEAEVENFYHDCLSEIVDPFEDEDDDDLDGVDEQRAWYDTSAELM